MLNFSVLPVHRFRVQLRALHAEIHMLETVLDIKGAPWTPGQVPEWSDIEP